MNIFKTNYRRVREGIMQSVGAHQVSEDSEFEAKLQAFQQLVREMERVHEAMLVWADCMDALAAAGAGLGDTMSKFISTNSSPASRSELDGSCKAYLSVQSDINESLRGSVRKNLMDRCLRPTTELLAVAPLINEKVAERKQLKLDSDFYNAKYKNEMNAGKDESDPKVAKIAGKMRDAEKALGDVSDELCTTFAEIEGAKHTLLVPELSALVGCQFFFMQNSTQMMSDVMSFFPQAASTLCMLHTEKAAAPYVSAKIVDNLKSTPAVMRPTTTAVPVNISASADESPAAHFATSHRSLRITRSLATSRPHSEQVRASPSPVAATSEKPLSVPLGASSTPKPPGLPGNAPLIPPPKPIKRSTSSSTSTEALRAASAADSLNPAGGDRPIASDVNVSSPHLTGQPMVVRHSASSIGRPPGSGLSATPPKAPPPPRPPPQVPPPSAPPHLAPR